MFGEYAIDSDINHDEIKEEYESKDTNETRSSERCHDRVLAKEEQSTLCNLEANQKVTLREALRNLADRIEQFSNNNKIVRLVCENGLHLRQCVHPQALRHNIPLHESFYKYFDLTHQYNLSKEAPTNEKLTLRNILKDIFPDEKFDEKSAKKKCELCSRVVLHLLKKGHTFIQLQEIQKCLENGMAEGEVVEDSVTRVRGLPWQVSDVDVADFFRGLDIERGGVALCLNEKGRRNGEALVRFSSAEHRELALRRHKHHLFGRYIEVYKAMAHEFTKTAKAPVSAMQCAERFLVNGGSVLIRMRGLPFDACVGDIIDFFCDSPAVFRGEEGVMLVTDGDGNPTGDAFVLFDSEIEGQLALRKHRENIGKRYVELFRSTRAEMQQVLTMYTNVNHQATTTSTISPILGPHPFAQHQPQHQVVLNQTNMSCLRMRGVPMSVGEKEIVAFLSTHVKNVIGSIHLMWGREGGSGGGDVLIQMRGEEVAWRCARDLHLQHISGKLVEVIQCSVREMACTLATSVALHLLHHHINNQNAATNTHLTNQSLQHVPLVRQVNTLIELTNTTSIRTNKENVNNLYCSTAPPPSTQGILATPHEVPGPGCCMLPSVPFPALQLPPPPPRPRPQQLQQQGVSANGLVFQNITLIPIYSNQVPPLPPMMIPPPPPPPPFPLHPFIPSPPSHTHIMPVCESVLVGSTDSLHIEVNQYDQHKTNFGKTDSNNDACPLTFTSIDNVMV